MTIIGDQIITLDTDCERQHTSVFFEGSRPGSTEDVVLAPAAGVEEIRSATSATAH